MSVIFRRKKINFQNKLKREWRLQIPYGTGWTWFLVFFFFYLRWRSWTSRDWPLLSTYPPAAPRVSCTESCTRSTWRSASSGVSKSGGSSVGKKNESIIINRFPLVVYEVFSVFSSLCIFCLFVFCFFFGGGGVWFVGFLGGFFWFCFFVCFLLYSY